MARVKHVVSSTLKPFKYMAINMAPTIYNYNAIINFKKEKAKSD
jgi:hypothetical protein